MRRAPFRRSATVDEYGLAVVAGDALAFVVGGFDVERDRHGGRGQTAKNAESPVGWREGIDRAPAGSLKPQARPATLPREPKIPAMPVILAIEPLPIVGASRCCRTPASSDAVIIVEIVGDDAKLPAWCCRHRPCSGPLGRPTWAD